MTSLSRGCRPLLVADFPDYTIYDELWRLLHIWLPNWQAKIAARALGAVASMDAELDYARTRSHMVIEDRQEATPAAGVSMWGSVFDRLRDRLQQGGVAYTVLRHEPVYTSEQAAAVRGTSLASGAKALLVKAGDRFVLLVLPADRKLDSKRARTALSVKALRFATKEEVLELTGLEPGSIPPFGSLFGMATYCDPALAESGFINFNAGDHAISVQMTYEDYLRVEKPTAAGVTLLPAPSGLP